jgi:hypothetical protein
MAWIDVFDLVLTQTAEKRNDSRYKLRNLGFDSRTPASTLESVIDVPALDVFRLDGLG